MDYFRLPSINPIGQSSHGGTRQQHTLIGSKSEVVAPVMPPLVHNNMGKEPAVLGKEKHRESKSDRHPLTLPPINTVGRALQTKKKPLRRFRSRFKYYRDENKPPQSSTLDSTSLPAPVGYGHWNMLYPRYIGQWWYYSSSTRPVHRYYDDNCGIKPILTRTETLTLLSSVDFSELEGSFLKYNQKKKRFDQDACPALRGPVDGRTETKPVSKKKKHYSQPHYYGPRADTRYDKYSTLLIQGSAMFKKPGTPERLWRSSSEIALLNNEGTNHPLKRQRSQSMVNINQIVIEFPPKEQSSNEDISRIDNLEQDVIHSSSMAMPVQPTKPSNRSILPRLNINIKRPTTRPQTIGNQSLKPNNILLPLSAHGSTAPSSGQSSPLLGNKTSFKPKLAQIKKPIDDFVPRWEKSDPLQFVKMKSPSNNTDYPGTSSAYTTRSTHIRNDNKSRIAKDAFKMPNLYPDLSVTGSQFQSLAQMMGNVIQTAVNTVNTMVQKTEERLRKLRLQRKKRRSRWPHMQNLSDLPEEDESTDYDSSDFTDYTSSAGSSYDSGSDPTSLGKGADGKSKRRKKRKEHKRRKHRTEDGSSMVDSLKRLSKKGNIIEKLKKKGIKLITEEEARRILMQSQSDISLLDRPITEEELAALTLMKHKKRKKREKDKRKRERRHEQDYSGQSMDDGTPSRRRRRREGHRRRDRHRRRRGSGHSMSGRSRSGRSWSGRSRSDSTTRRRRRRHRRKGRSRGRGLTRRKVEKIGPNGEITYYYETVEDGSELSDDYEDGGADGVKGDRKRRRKHRQKYRNRRARLRAKGKRRGEDGEYIGSSDFTDSDDFTDSSDYTDSEDYTDSSDYTYSSDYTDSSDEDSESDWTSEYESVYESVGSQSEVGEGEEVFMRNGRLVRRKKRGKKKSQKHRERKKRRSRRKAKYRDGSGDELDSSSIGTSSLSGSSDGDYKYKSKRSKRRRKEAKRKRRERDGTRRKRKYRTASGRVVTGSDDILEISRPTSTVSKPPIKGRSGSQSGRRRRYQTIITGPDNYQQRVIDVTGSHRDLLNRSQTSYHYSQLGGDDMIMADKLERRRMLEESLLSDLDNDVQEIRRRRELEKEAMVKAQIEVAERQREEQLRKEVAYERKEREKQMVVKKLEQLKDEIEKRRVLHLYQRAVVEEYYEGVEAWDLVDYAYIESHFGSKYRQMIIDIDKERKLAEAILMEQQLMENFELKRQELLLKLKQAHEKFSNALANEILGLDCNAKISRAFVTSYFNVLDETHNLFYVE